MHRSLILVFLLFDIQGEAEVTFSHNAVITMSQSNPLIASLTTEDLNGSQLTLTLGSIIATTGMFEYGTADITSTIFLTLPEEENTRNTDDTITQLFYAIETGAVYKKVVSLSKKKNENKTRKILSLAKEYKKSIAAYKKSIT